MATGGATENKTSWRADKKSGPVGRGFNRATLIDGSNIKKAVLAGDGRWAIGAADAASSAIVAPVPWPWRWPSKPGPSGNGEVAGHGRGLERQNHKRTGDVPEPRVRRDA